MADRPFDVVSWRYLARLHQSLGDYTQADKARKVIAELEAEALYEGDPRPWSRGPIARRWRPQGAMKRAARAPSAPSAKARKARRRAPAARTAERARRELDRAAERVRTAAAALTRVADQIAAEALEGERGQAGRELASEQILRDLAKLQRAFTAAPDGSLPSELEVLRKLPDAVLAWARDRFGVTPHLAVGQELECPATACRASSRRARSPRAAGWCACA
jgi:hypothetical protein